MQRRLLVLNVASTSLTALAWVLLVAALAAGQWTTSSGSTSTSSLTFGAVSIEQSGGLYQTTTKVCCLAAGSPVPEMALTSCDRRCLTSTISSSRYCNYVASEQSISLQGISAIHCGRVEAAVIVVILLTIVTVLSLFGGTGLFLAKKIRCGVYAVSLAPAILCSLICIIVYKLLANDEIANFFDARFAPDEAAGAPFSTELGNSYGLLVAGFVFQLLGVVCAGLRWAFRPRRIVPPPKIPTAPEPSFMMTPERREVQEVHLPYRTSPSRSGGPYDRELDGRQSPIGTLLPLCPNDLNCAFADNFTHQLEYAHTCRNPSCNDTSTGHNQHWVHDRSRPLALRQSAPSSRWKPPTATDPAFGAETVSVSDAGEDHQPLGNSQSMQRVPSWLQPIRNGAPPPLGVDQRRDTRPGVAGSRHASVRF